MFTIDKKNKIILTRGDTATINVKIVDNDGRPYSIKTGDAIIITARKTPSSPIVFQKTAEGNHIIIDSNNTKNLNPGLYIYDIQLTTSTGAIYTIIPQSFLDLREEVSY